MNHIRLIGEGLKTMTFPIVLPQFDISAEQAQVRIDLPALSDRNPIVLGSMQHQGRRIRLVQIKHRRVLDVTSRVLPHRSAQLETGLQNSGTHRRTTTRIVFQCAKDPRQICGACKSPPRP
jgi:hypothetical protein